MIKRRMLNYSAEIVSRFELIYAYTISARIKALKIKLI